jgi:hypothetical protein
MTLSWRGLDSNFQYAGAVNLVVAPFFCRRKLGRGRCALSVFGQPYALHQSDVDPTAEAAIRAGDAQRQILAWSGKKTETLYRVTAPADPVLVHGNRLCRAKRPQPLHATRRHAGAAVKCRTAAVDGGGRHGRRLEIRSSR